MTLDLAPISILLIDDHEVVRTGLRLLLESWPNLKVVAEASDPRRALTATEIFKPDIILADLDRGLRDNVLEQIPELLSAAPGARILLLTGTEDVAVHCRAIVLGASGVVLKARAANELKKAIAKVHEGELWLNRKLTASLVFDLTRGKARNGDDPEILMLGFLTSREREVATLVCEGLKNKEIGERLFISETTVRHHMSSIFAKLKVSTRFELLVFLHRHKFVADTPERAAAQSEA